MKETAGLLQRVEEKEKKEEIFCRCQN